VDLLGRAGFSFAAPFFLCADREVHATMWSHPSTIFLIFLLFHGFYSLSLWSARA
jgi:hypothetical protein